MVRFKPRYLSRTTYSYLITLLRFLSPWGVRAHLFKQSVRMFAGRRGDRDVEMVIKSGTASAEALERCLSVHRRRQAVVDAKTPRTWQPQMLRAPPAARGNVARSPRTAALL